MERLLCKDCGTKTQESTVQEQAGMHFAFMWGILKIDKPPSGVVIVLDEEGTTEEYQQKGPCVCDNCGKELPKGTEVCCWTAWGSRRPASIAWVADYLERVTRVNKKDF